ncbi:MAG: caspase family protein [Chitinophagaceae bacterium]|nr:MAG: caspase family protein [Chitinophagaceae bacterium]
MKAFVLLFLILTGLAFSYPAVVRSGLISFPAVSFNRQSSGEQDFAHHRFVKASFDNRNITRVGFNRRNISQVGFNRRGFSEGGQKRALIIAIGKYPESSRIRPIAALNDIPFIRSALLKNDFPEKNIDTLVNEKATKSGILNALRSLATHTLAGDIVVIHFSCHGQQIRDQRTVELGRDEDDGYDEALVPYDARNQYDPTGYHGENHLRDDDLDPVLSDIRRRIGRTGSLLVLLDACHSGTGTRASSFAVSRGEPKPFIDPENPMTGLIETGMPEPFFSSSDSMSNMVVFSGTGPNQLNYQMRVDNKDVGSLSYSFYKAMQDLEAGSTYRLLFEKIRATIQAGIPDQLPVAEGDLDQEVFSGQFKKAQDTWFIKVGGPKRTAVTDTQFVLGKGGMDNIHAGATAKIYLPGSADPVAAAVIRQTAGFNSVGIASVPLKKNLLYEIRMDEEYYGDFSAVLRFAPMPAALIPVVPIPKKSRSAARESFATPSPSPLELQVKRWMKPYQFIRFADQADYELMAESKGDGYELKLSDRQGRTVWRTDFVDTLQLADRVSLMASLKKVMRLKYLREIEDGGSLSKLTAASLQSKDNPSTETVPVFAAGEHYYLKMENRSTRRLFYTVLDLLPDNTLEILYPYGDKDASNYSIEPGGQITRELGVSREPVTGKEMIRIFFTREPMDLRAVFARKKERATDNSFQKMMNDLFKDEGEGATRADVGSINVEEIGIVTVGFIVK